ncbi:glycosyl hydrolases family 18 protein [Colletotrichum incanum]|nr:glycosyl hydrolases family 18 protein [Colletotrichum incanum]
MARSYILVGYQSDYSAKPARDRNFPVCPKDSSLAAVHARDLLLGRQVTRCSETKPCANGACCPKETGWCNYGPNACGTTGVSPNDVCWSNCDAKAECGRYADPPGKECPLNVCCSPWGFCRMTEDFRKVIDDKETSCQSNCDQPKSGASGSNIRNREAWFHERSCNGMSIDDIPVGSLTHLMFSFAYITPNDFHIVPMDDLKPNLFSKMSALTSPNKALKVMVALGGWTFNDPGPTQRVCHDLASTKANRAKFIRNLLSFLRQYAFDDVDFDWSPRADDRGGEKEDGKNFTLLLEELRDAVKAQPLDYVVSFTTPTSFWYPRHFDIKGSTDAVDFVNIMSNFHGVWDAWNPIGSNVLAHTNITEVKLALDLYWRNDIPPAKLNLDFGFYGRSFQLSDPACHKPGCPFLGGAAPGRHKLKPCYDKESQVKYIVWNQDQWISYTSLEKKNKCSWRGKGKSSNSAGQLLTFSGGFGKKKPDLDKLYKLKGSSLASALKDYDLSDIDLYCCPPEDMKRCNNCEWEGKPGNCFDGHCDINTQVQVAWANFGGAEGCFPRLDRTRVFCCGPPAGENIFLPVPLEDLFPNPPTSDNVDTNFDLKVDSTWGGVESGGSDDADPGDAAFQFYVLVAPEEIQTSLDKRDGSHWEVFNCNDAVSEDEQTVQMIYTNDSDESNCDNIFKGLGAEGTIIQMPQGQGCGPGKYAVVKSLEVAGNQTLPKRLVKRKYGSLSEPAVIYDLTFDYDFTRVPRDFGDTQLRVDFSNQENYWDQVTKAPARKKTTRSLESVGGRHKRWLEEEWREDMHFGALSRDELHKRWFGVTTIEWLEGLLHFEYNEKRHDYEEEIQVIIL